MDEEQLLAGCLAGRPEAWTGLRDLVVRLAGGVAAQRLGLAPDAVDDVVQMTLVALLRDDRRALRSFRGSSRLSSYLTTIVLRMAMRHASSLAGEASLDGAAMAAPAEACDPAEPPAFLNALTPADRMIVCLGADDYSADEIACEVEAAYGLRLTSAAVRKRKERALNRLRERLANDEIFNPTGDALMKKAL